MIAILKEQETAAEGAVADPGDEKVRSNIEWFYRPISEFLDHFESQ